MKKVMLIFGTRPEAIKMCPLVKEFQKDTINFKTVVCVTAQHREMLDQVLHVFDVKPEYDLNIMKQGQDLYDITSRVLLGLRDVLKKELPDKNIWAYSGYLYEDFLPGGKVYCEASEPFLSMIDVMVDGPFILEKKDISLNFRGSSNQRIIDVPETRKNQEIILLME